MEKAPCRIVVVGGGTAGWMAAAALVSTLPARRVDVTLIESEAIGIIGVGEATLPHLKYFNDTIGVDEAAFIRETHATMKLGIEFENWGRIGDRYVHPFGEFGRPVNGTPFHQAWTWLRRRRTLPELGRYSLPVRMCAANKFDRPSPEFDSIRSTYAYAYQFDATRYAPFLRRHAEARGARRIEGIVDGVNRNPERGDIASLRLKDGREIAGDFFVDCSGFRGLLIEGALEAGYETWSHWLPCDRAIAAPCESAGPPPPFTRATALEAGWRWRIPLQHRTGNGHVYASAFTTDERACELLMSQLEGPLLAEPKPLRFTTGRRRKFWSHNCISAGLAAGFLEPLESTSIHLTQIAITNFIELFPLERSFDAERTQYNAMMRREYERVRDFLILHYHATQRTDSEFWNHVRTMTVPESLAAKIALFKARGRVATYQQGLFLEPSWLAVYFGQNIIPDEVDARLETLDHEAVEASFHTIAEEVDRAVDRLPGHADWLQATGMQRRAVHA